MQHKIEIAIDGTEIPLRLDGALLEIEVEGGTLAERDRLLYFDFHPDGTIEIEVLENQNGDFEVIGTVTMSAADFAESLLIKMMQKPQMISQ